MYEFLKPTERHIFDIFTILSQCHKHVEMLCQYLHVTMLYTLYYIHVSTFFSYKWIPKVLGVLLSTYEDHGNLVLQSLHQS